MGLTESSMETTITSQSTWHVIILKRRNSLVQRLGKKSSNLALQQNWTPEYARNRLLVTSRLDLVAKWRVCFCEPIWTENFHKFWCFPTAIATSSRINLNSNPKVALLSFCCPSVLRKQDPDQAAVHLLASMQTKRKLEDNASDYWSKAMRLSSL